MKIYSPQSSGRTAKSEICVNEKNISLMENKCYGYVKINGDSWHGEKKAIMSKMIRVKSVFGAIVNLKAVVDRLHAQS